jgi:pimeloyl-ACP methyl ester carboxylesterase
MTDPDEEARRVTVDGREVAVCEWGDSSGRPVFYLHGAPGSRLLRHVGPHGSDALYADHGLRVVTLDRPGYGCSTRRPGHRVVDAADDVAAVADALGLERFGIVGVSAGSPAALASAAALGPRVVRVGMVVAPGPYRASDLDFFAGVPEEARAQWEFADLHGEAQQEWFARDWVGTQEFVREVLPTFNLPPEEVRMLGEALGEGIRPGPDGLYDDLLAFTAPWGFSVDDVEAPVRLLQAEDDDGIPRGHTEWYLAHLKQSEVRWVPGGHFDVPLDEELALLRWTAGLPEQG